MLRLAFDFIITWRETRTRPNAYKERVVSLLKTEFDTTLLSVIITICNF